MEFIPITISIVVESYRDLEMLYAAFNKNSSQFEKGLPEGTNKPKVTSEDRIGVSAIWYEIDNKINGL